MVEGLFPTPTVKREQLEHQGMDACIGERESHCDIGSFDLLREGVKHRKE